jgi:membrane protease YdiL (CAAX protease family)
VLWWVAVAAVAILTAASFDGLRAMGLRRANFFRSLWVVGMALAMAAIAVTLAGGLHTLHLPAGGPIGLIANYWAYALWACVQQFLLQCFFLSRLLRLLPNAKAAALAASAVFAAAHLPNPILTPITFVWGLFACLVFIRYRNLYPLALAHAILGIAIAITVPGAVDHNMRVGLGYLTYGHRIHPAHPASTQP